MTEPPVQCSLCLYDSSHPLGLVINSEGICSGCIVHREKSELDWESRLERLGDVLSQRKRVAGAKYDCVIPVRGTPEYFFLVDIVVNQLGLSPLLTQYNTQFNSVIGIRNLARMLEVFDCNFEQQTTNPSHYRDMVRHSLFNLGSLRWPALSGEVAFAFSTAISKGIPSVLFPYHDSVEQVGAHSYLNEATFSRPAWEGFDLMAVPESKFFGPSSAVPREIRSDFALDDEFGRVGVTGFYAANFIPWDSRSFSEAAVSRFGALGAKVPHTFDTYDKVDDVFYMLVHNKLKLAKLGFGRVTDSLVREIRFGRITRNQAMSISKTYESKQMNAYPVDEFREWLGVTPEAMDWLFDYWGGAFPFGGLERGQSLEEGLEPDDDEVRAIEFEEGWLSHGEMNLQPFLFGKGLEITEEL